VIQSPVYSCDSSGLGTYQFAVDASGGSPIYTFSDGTISNTDGDFTVAATSTTTIVSISVTDANGCVGTPVDVSLPGVDTIQLTNNSVGQCVTNGDQVLVPFTGGVTPIRYRRVGESTFTTASVAAGNFVIDTNINVAGTYNYEIIDANATDDSCVQALEIIFYEDITTRNIVIGNLACDALGAIPTSDATISFEVEGGSGNYTYSYETTSIAETTILPTTPSTVQNPTLSFDNTFDGVAITIYVNDVSGCGAPRQINFIPNYPEAPSVTTAYNPIECFGGTTGFTVTPVNARANYQYNFNGEGWSNASTYYTASGTLNYQVQDLDSGCILDASEIIPDATPISFTEDNVIGVTCDDTQTGGSGITNGDGSFTFTVNGGSGNYSIEVTAQNDLTYNFVTTATTGNSVTVNSLEIDIYQVTVTDSGLTSGVLCQDTFFVNVPPLPLLRTVDQNFDNVTCTGGATLYLVIDGGSAPDNLQFQLSSGDPMVDPSAITTDDFAQYGDTDFNATTPGVILPPDYTTISSSLPGDTDIIDQTTLDSRYFRISSMLPGSTYNLEVTDTVSGCSQLIQVNTPSSLSIAADVSATTDSSACGNATGTVTVSYTIDPSLSGENFTANLVDANNASVVISSTTFTAPVSGTTITGSFTISAIDTGIDYRVDLYHDGGDCSDSTALFDITSATPLSNFEYFGTPANCVDTATLSLSVQNGVSPYQFAIVAAGDPAPTTFTESQVISSATILSLADASGALNVDAYVEDASGCIESLLGISIAPAVEPTLSLGISPEECNANGTFTNTYTIGNYNAANSYFFDVNGDTPENSQMQISAPDATGNGTIVFENRDSYVIEVVASDNPNCPASYNLNMAADALVASLSLGTVDCSDNLDGLTVTVEDGYLELDRTLVFEIFEASDLSTVIETATQNYPTVLGAYTYTFSGLTSLTASTDYVVRVSDSYALGSTTCSFDAEFVYQPIDYATVSIINEEISCNGLTDGSLLVNTSALGSSPVSYVLYEYASLADATAAETANAFLTGTDVTATYVNATDSNLFENLPTGFYVVFVGNSVNPCYQAAPVQEIIEPNAFTGTGITPQVVQASCNPIADAQIQIEITGTIDGVAPYYYRVTGILDSYTQINDTTIGNIITIPGVPDYDTTYTVELIDANSLVCGATPISVNVTIDPYVETPDLDLLAQTASYSCTTDEVISIGITNADPTEVFTVNVVTAVDFEGNALTAPTQLSNTNLTAEYQLIDPGVYIFEAESSVGCLSSQYEYVVNELEPLLVDALGSSVSCFGDTSIVSFDVINYVGDFNYSITNDDTMLSYSGGSVSDWGGVPTVVAPTSLTASINASNLVEVDGLPVGNYTISVEASSRNFCSNLGIAQIIGPDMDVVITSAQAITPISCIIPYAEFLIEAEGGYGNYTYSVSGGTLTGSVQNTSGLFDISYQLGAGTYAIEVVDTDNPSCPSANTVLIISDPNLPVLDSSVTSYSISCNGGNTSITVGLDATATAPSADLASIRYALYYYDASATDNKGGIRIAPQPSGTFTGVESGEYWVEVSDELGCTDGYQITVTEPDQLQASSVLVDPFNCDHPNYEVHQVNVVGGTPTAGGLYNYELISVTDLRFEDQTFTAQVNTDGLFNLSPLTINTIQVSDANSCVITTVIATGTTIEDINYEIQHTTSNICFGSTDGFVTVTNGLTGVTGGEGDYLFVLYQDAVAAANIVNQSNTNPFFDGLGEGDYIYEVQSANCTPVTYSFTINDAPEMVMDLEVNGISCVGSNDGTASVSIVENALDPFSSPVDLTYTIEATNGSFTRSYTSDSVLETVVFEELSADIEYEVRITNVNSNGCYVSDTFTIANKTNVFITSYDQTGGTCIEDLDAAIQLYVSGGERTVGNSYYYQIRTDLDANIDLGQIKAEANELVYVGTDVNGDQFTVTEIFEPNTTYEIVIVDEGNGQDGDEFSACITTLEFSFEADDLDNFTPVITADCDNLGYVLSVQNDGVSEVPENLNIHVFDVITGDQVALGGFDLAPIDLAPGSYYVEIHNQITGCASTTPIYLDDLGEYAPISFIEEDALGQIVQPFAATSEINKYILQVEGGINPNGANPYRYEGFYVNEAGEAFEMFVDNDGKFEVTQSGVYQFFVYDNYSDNDECFDETNSISLNYIEIAIPNVFNPSSRDPLMSSWYPENLVADYINQERSINPIDDPSAPQVPVIYQTTDGILTGGTLTDGTTTGACTVGGSVSASTGSVNSIIPVNVNSTYHIISGDYIIEISTTVSGLNSVIVYEGATVSGGTADASGLISGGTLSGGSIFDTYADDENLLFTFNGTTTGGTTTGGISTGGTTLGSITNNATSTNATTVGGTTTSGTTIAIDFNTTDITLTTLANTTVNGGTTRGGQTTGGRLSGGVLTGGNSVPIAIEYIDYDNIEVIILDRYGRQLAEFVGIKDKASGDQGWDGTYQGNNMPSGDYWYIVKLNDAEQREYSGHFTLYRR